MTANNILTRKVPSQYYLIGRQGGPLPGSCVMGVAKFSKLRWRGCSHGRHPPPPKLDAPVALPTG